MRHPRRPRTHVDHANALRRAQYAKAKRRIERALDRGESITVITDTHHVLIRRSASA